MELKSIIPCWVSVMLDDKRLKEIEKKVPIMINDGEIRKDEEN